MGEYLTFKNEYEYGYSDGRASMIEEFEKIKTELTDLKLDLCDYPKSVVFKVLDNHIKELKGEKNE